jgi:hypothetical protein
MSYACGLGAIPWLLMGEVFPSEVKGVATAICTAVNWTLAFSVTRTVSPLTQVRMCVCNPKP